MLNQSYSDTLSIVLQILGCLPKSQTMFKATEFSQVCELLKFTPCFCNILVTGTKYLQEMYHSESMGLLHLPQSLNFDAIVFLFVVCIMASENTMNAFAFHTHIFTLPECDYFGVLPHFPAPHTT